MHNAFASTQAGFLVAQHRACIPGALLKGVRAFMMDVHLSRAGDIVLCHVSCALGSVSLGETLDVFREFLASNPREVVTIFWELGYDMRVNPSTADTSLLRQKLNHTMHSSQLVAFAHVQQLLLSANTTGGSAAPEQIARWPEWPTLRTMISRGKRLVIFTDCLYCDNNNDGWENYMHSHVVQTSFKMWDITSLDRACTVGNGWHESRMLVVVNHFTALGALGMSGATFGKHSAINFFANINNNPFFAQRILSCMEDLYVFPSFIAVDFWESSDVLEVTNMINSNFYFANATWHSKGVASVARALGFA